MFPYVRSSWHDRSSADEPTRAGEKRNVAVRTSSRRSTPVKAYQLEVSLCNVTPPIWRRLQVLGDTSLHRFHRILQTAFGWTNSHLHLFAIGDRVFSEPRPDDYIDPPEDERRVRLRDFALRRGSTLRYVYDYGDHWEHRIVVEAVFEPVPGLPYPCCIGGERATPPEDSGGAYGYAELLDALRDPQNPKHASTLQWVPAGFDPEAFDVFETTKLLERIYDTKPRRKRSSTPRNSEGAC